MIVQPENTSKLSIVDAEDTQNESLTALLNAFSNRGEEIKRLDIPESQENTRSLITLIVVSSFSGIISLFALVAAYVSLWGEIEKLELIGKFILLISGIISPVVTFILGYYFATKMKD